MLVGALFWGLSADVIGRKVCYSIRAERTLVKRLMTSGSRLRSTLLFSSPPSSALSLERHRTGSCVSIHQNQMQRLDCLTMCRYLDCSYAFPHLEPAETWCWTLPFFSNICPAKISGCSRSWQYVYLSQLSSRKDKLTSRDAGVVGCR